MDVETGHFLDTVSGEVSFFRSLMRTRPVGIHRYFHVLAMRNSIHRDTGHWVSAEDLWLKLKSCYDLDILEGIDAEHFENSPSGNSPPQLIRSPSPSDNLNMHPFFREEFTLPHDPTIESIMARRRRRGTASISSASEPALSPAVEKPVAPSRSSKRGKMKLTKMTGLVGGDSDSSALTQDSADEGGPGSLTQRQGSVATGTDAGTEFAEVEEEEDQEGTARDQSPATAKNTRRSSKASASTKRSARTRGSSVSKPPTKKRKR